MVDTRHFDEGFKYRLLAGFEDIGEALDGVLVHSENYAALRTLEAKYRGRVKCIYIDPPYNTGSDEFLYKDDFSRHSAWLAMMEERLTIGRETLTSDGTLFSSIDDNELPRLRQLLDAIFSDESRLGTVVWKGATDNNPTRISIEHEYMLAYARDVNANQPVWSSRTVEAKEIMLAEHERLTSMHSDLDQIQKRFRQFIRNNKELLSPLTHYDRIDKDGPYTGGRKVHNPGREGYRYDVLHPNGRPCVQPARGYRFPEETMKRLLAEDRIIFGDDENQIIQIKEYLKDYEGSFKGLIELDSRVGANILESLFGSREVFRNPKPVELISRILDFVTNGLETILDYFAGSGTTGHAVIDMNRNGA